MNVADLELSQELFELSGWQTDSYVQTVNRNMSSEYVTIEKFEDDETLDDVGGDCFAYDLSFILGKLPPDSGIVKNNSGTYNAWCTAIDELFMRDASIETSFIDDTAENAIAKLAIQLFRQGVLVREAK